MTLHLHAAWLIGILLASIRLSALLMFTPLLGGTNAPAAVRIVTVLGLTATLLAALPAGAPALDASPGALVAAAALEVLVGAAMGFGLHGAFASFGFAGKLLDLQVGFSVAQVFDPVTRSASPLLGSLLTLLGAAIFYATDCHHLLLRAVAHSFERLPPGSPWPDLPAAVLIEPFGTMFILGLTLAAPVIVALLLVDVGLGVISRTMPQMNVFLVGLTVKVGAGLLLVWLTLGAVAPTLHLVFARLFSQWQRLFANL